MRVTIDGDVFSNTGLCAGRRGLVTSFLQLLATCQMTHPLRVPKGHTVPLVQMKRPKETNTGKYSSIQQGYPEDSQRMTHRTTRGEHHALTEALLSYGLEGLSGSSPAAVSTEPPQAPSQ